MPDSGHSPLPPMLGPPPASHSVASTKLVPPRAARRHRCVVLQGPAGSGKTSTLVAWRKVLLAVDFDVAWLSLAAEDNEPERFFDCLLASLAEVQPSMVRAAALLSGRDGDASAVEHWVIALVGGIASRPRELVLVLDDLQHVDSPSIIEALQCLLDYAPPNLHLALGTRSTPPLALSRLRTQQQLAEFDLNDLRFSPEESERFLRDQLGDIDAREAAVLHQLTDGWVAGLQLFALDLKGKKGAAFAPTQLRDEAAFTSYFEREVLVQLAPDDLDLLTRLSICNRFSASLCAQLAGQPRAVARMMARLTHLDNETLFIAQIKTPERETWYRLHPLLRQVLQRRLEAMPAQALRELHALAWRWFERHGLTDEAVRHAVHAGNADEAAELVEARLRELYLRGELSQMSALLRRLPAGQVQARFGLRLLQAHLQLYARDLDGVVLAITELQAAAQRGELDDGQHYALTLLRGGLALQRDDSDAVVAILPELEHVPPQADEVSMSGRGSVLSWMYMYRGEYERARAVLEEEATREGPLRGALVGRCLGGMSHALEGDILRAERIFRDVLHEAEKYGAAYIGVACMAAGLLGDAMYELNEVETTRQMLEARIEVLERVSIPDTVVRALATLATTHWVCGRRQEARAWIDRLEDYAILHGLDRLLGYALCLRHRWHLQQGELEHAAVALERLEALGARYADATRSTSWEISVAARRARIDLYLHRKQFDAAIALLVPLIEVSEAGGRWRRVAGLYMQLALARHACGREGAARESLLKALRLGHRLGLMRTLLDVSSRVPAVIGALLDGHPADAVLDFYVQRLRAAADRPSPAPAPATGTDGLKANTCLSEREAEVLELLAQAMPNKRIARVLAVSPETVKWHLKNIYVKLDVTGRDEAVARYRDAALR